MEGEVVVTVTHYVPMKRKQQERQISQITITINILHMYYIFRIFSKYIEIDHELSKF